MKQIVPGVYYFTGLMSGRVYLIEDPDGLTLIDAGLASAPPKIVAQLRAGGYEPTQVKRILITHGHQDHIGGLPALKELTGAQVIASGAERPLIEGWEATSGSDPANLPLPIRLMAVFMPALPGAPVDRVVADGEILPEVLGGLTVIEVGGHTPGHLAFWQADRRILFCGDILMRMPYRLHLPFAGVSVDMAQVITAVKRLATLQPEIICLGHGNPITRQAAETLDRFARKVGAG